MRLIKVKVLGLIILSFEAQCTVPMNGWLKYLRFPTFQLEKHRHGRLIRYFYFPGIFSQIGGNSYLFISVYSHLDKYFKKIRRYKFWQILLNLRYLSNGICVIKAVILSHKLQIYVVWWDLWKTIQIEFYHYNLSIETSYLFTITYVRWQCPGRWLYLIRLAMWRH